MISSAMQKLSLVKYCGSSFVKYSPIASSNRYLCSRFEVSRLNHDEDLAAFRGSLPRFLDKVNEYSRSFDQTLASEWFDKCVKYNIFDELPNIGYLLYITYKAAASESQLTDENLELVRMVAWCMKLLDSTVQITDDFVDGATIRRGNPCWYTLPDVKNQFAHDALLLSLSVYPVLEKFVGHKEYYPQVNKIFMDGSFCVFLGQTLDILLSRENVIYHTMKKYEHLVALKTANDALYAPIALALHMSGYNDPAIYENMKKVMRALAFHWQAKNDFLDVFSSSANITCSDVQENKLTWLTATFMERANEDQVHAMQQYYGSCKPEDVGRVRLLLEEVGVDKVFLEHEKRLSHVVNQMIEESPYEKLKPVLRIARDNVIHKYYKQ